MGHTQTGFAKLLEIERSYLSQLENGRTVQPWVMKKLKIIEEEFARNDSNGDSLSRSQINVPEDPFSYRDYDDEDLLALLSHFSRQRNTGPEITQGIYKKILADVQAEVARRLGIGKRTSKAH